MFDKKYVISNGLAFAEDEEMEMLSSYAKKGWILYKLDFFGYKLRKGEPKDLQYSLDYRRDPDKEYFSYFKEAGWSHVCSSGNSIHIFSAPLGTKPIYTDSCTEIEKYMQQYKSARKAAIPSSISCVIFLIIVLLSRYDHIPYVYGIVFNILLIPVFVITVFSGLPCISYYLRINRVGEVKNKNFSKNRKAVYVIAIIMTLLLIFIIFFNIFYGIHVGKIIFYTVWFTAVVLWMAFCFMK
ncbi:DUF2812 domain-containing protein [Clostridium luticellarii]|uniref:DUF2812 domain-containing protein n=1 Tax=Clostridium luticellarii TaxID=1691940 RepID=A0A2T0BME5_9CLOT|nr:DUF2812 domain-containing protein [Clostridium luticellarii]MCI1944992.1 DUF2812 domain-containing protein [Clostridium luticellarii]MCI1967858.1 DUF2812 domain-containing protein [Clostridium luticellarii]MCI1995772.1 DUF2812 domain-containing protein [Clostridium luticellarii]MCI2040747.1 DUF2812 domain-containing protein [Clostridium luticellarii]PRR85048.1 hypothetical protein CLLU_19620 [Clostridium luticellarii]